MLFPAIKAGARLRWLTTTKCLTSRRWLSGAQTSDNAQHYDVLIVGGGPVGLALATSLGSSRAMRGNCAIALVEAGDLSKIQDWAPSESAFSNRVSSITNASLTFLQRIGVWDHVDLGRTAPIAEVKAWDGVSDARIAFNADDLGLNHQGGQLARLMENLNLQRALLRHLRSHGEVDIYDNVKVTSIAREVPEDPMSWPMVYLSNGRAIRTRLLVGADGFNSPVRSFAGIPSFGWSYDAQGIVATLNHHPRGAFEPPNHTAYQRFLPTGPIAFLPLSPTASSLVWSTKPQIASALIGADPAVLASIINAAFRLPEVSMRYLNQLILEAQESKMPLVPSEIQQEISWRERSHGISPNSVYSSAHESKRGVPPADSGKIPPLVDSVQPGTIASFPLRFSHTESYIGEGAGNRTVLVGDAAHTIHPLAGQGLNLGIADVEVLSNCIIEAIKLGQDCGALTTLQPYARERYFENHKMMAVVDKLHKLYSTTFEPVVWARSVGLEIINEVDPIKAAMVFSAGGFSQSRREGPSLGEMAVSGVVAAASGVGAVRMLAESASGLARAGLDAAIKTYQEQKR